MSYDPKLKLAMEEITEICKKYNCGGYFVLASKTHSEFMFHFPEWSKAQMHFNPEEGKYGIMFTAKGKAGDEDITSSVHLLQSIQFMCGHGYMQMDKLIELLKEHMTIEGGPAGFEPHDPTKKYQ
jgi:hypothetical protein